MARLAIANPAVRLRGLCGASLVRSRAMMGVFIFLFLKAIGLPLCSGELYATGHAAPMGYNPNLIQKTGLLTKIAKRGYLGTLRTESGNPRKAAEPLRGIKPQFASLGELRPDFGQGFPAMDSPWQLRPQRRNPSRK